MKGVKKAAKEDAQNFYIDFLKGTFETEKPLACLLRTDSGYYLYDTGTNKILECEKEVFDLLHGLFFKEINQKEMLYRCRRFDSYLRKNFHICPSHWQCGPRV